MRIAIVGAGSAGLRHLALARELNPEADIRMLAYTPLEHVPVRASGNLTSLDELARFQPNMAVIATPATRRLAALQVLAGTGAALLVEKPLASDLGEATEVAQICATGYEVSMVGYNLRFTACAPLVRSAVIDRAIGDVLGFRCEVGQYLPDWRPAKDYRTSASARSDLGGGALLELSHEVDYLHWILGTPEWVLSHESRQSTLEIDVEDSVHAVIGFRGTESPRGPGATGTVSLDLFRRDPSRLLNVQATEGSLTWDVFAGEVHRYDPSTSKWNRLLSEANDVRSSHRRQWQHFIACYRGESEPRVSVQSALVTAVLISAIRESSLSGRKLWVGVANGDTGESL